MSELPPGVYQSLLTDGLSARLPPDEQLYRLAALDPQTHPGRLPPTLPMSWR